MVSGIVFVNPPLAPEARYGLLSRAGGTEPPFGLCYLAATARENGYRSSIVDAQALRLDERSALEKVLSLKPRYVGFTAVTASIHRAAVLANLLKECDPRIITMIGGPHVSALPAETLRCFPAFDVGVVGEGEETLKALLDVLENHKDIDPVEGVVFRRDGRVIVTSGRPPIPDLDVLPQPAFDLLPDIARTYRVPAQSVDRLPAVSLVTARGCTGRCVFCDRSVFGNRCRTHSPGYVMDIVRTLYHRHGVRSIMFENDNMFLFKPQLQELLRLLKAEKLDLSWSCAGRVDMVDKDLLRDMKDAGCWQVQYGIESGSQRILDGMHKDISLEQTRIALRLTREAGIRAKGFIILGNPFETEETLAETLSFVLDSGLDDISQTFLAPTPGTEVRNGIERYGTLDDDWSRMTQFEAVFVPRGLTAGRLAAFSRQMYRRFYFRARVIVSYLGRVRHPIQFRDLFLAALALVRHACFGRHVFSGQKT